MFLMTLFVDVQLHIFSFLFVNCVVILNPNYETHKYD